MTRNTPILIVVLPFKERSYPQRVPQVSEPFESWAHVLYCHQQKSRNLNHSYSLQTLQLASKISNQEENEGCY